MLAVVLFVNLKPRKPIREEVPAPRLRSQNSVAYSCFPARAAIVQSRDGCRQTTTSGRRLGESLPDFSQLLNASTGFALSPFNTACLSRWSARWAARPVSNISRQDIGEYFGELTRKGASAGDLARERNLILSFFRWAQRRGWVRANPTDGLQRTRPLVSGRAVIWNPQEQGRLLAACLRLPTPAENAEPQCLPPRYLYPLVLTALRTGLRLGHLLNLEWRHVDMRQGLIKIPANETSTGREIQTTLDRELQLSFREILHLACKSAYKSPRVFDAINLPNWKGRPDHHTVLSAFRLARQRAGITNGGFDSLRLTFAHNCAVACIPIGYPLRVGDWDESALVEQVYAEHDRRGSSR